MGLSLDLTAAILTSPVTAGRNLIRPVAPSGIALLLQGTEGQTADLQQWQNAAEIVLVTVDSFGALLVGSGAEGSDARLVMNGDANEFQFYQQGRQIWNLHTNTADDPVLRLNDAQNGRELARFVPGSAGTASTLFFDQVVVHAAADQTAELQRWQNPSGVPLLSVDASGHLTFGEATNLIFGTTTGTKIGTAADQRQAFWGVTPVAQPVLATAAGHTVDDVVTLLQIIGLCRQS